ncbi:hypothetical protein F4802DRAFT_217599 [Xylaria palmicola]|nr:hypothetical protein F4802DRAFT_217599 [Xylaria palmicola]
MARFGEQQAGLEVVPPETGLHPLPTPRPLYAVPQQPWQKAQLADVESGARLHAQALARDGTVNDARKTILGLSVPVFWGLIVILFIVLAGGIGGGVGGGLSAQQKSTTGSAASSGGGSSTSGGASTSTAAPSPTTSSAADPLVPTDGGCPNIHDLGYTPYSADGKPIPIQTGHGPQEFREQCWTNWANTGSTHDILRTYTPTLENCIVVCAEYNKAYVTNLANNRGVGGGLCVAVTIVKEHAGFCYLKNGTGTNDTMGTPNAYSSAVLITS